MGITQQHLDQAYSDYGSRYGGGVNDYFALLYLKQEFGLTTEDAARQVSFGPNDYGFDGYHIDKAERNLFLYHSSGLRTTSFLLNPFDVSLMRACRGSSEILCRTNARTKC